MTTARAFSSPSAEDIYANLDEREADVPSCRRITIPAIRRAKIRSRETFQRAKTEPPPSPPPPRTVSNEMALVPDQSVRRLKATRMRVAGTPDQIQEPVTEAMLRDPRRE